MQHVFPALGITPTVAGVQQFVKLSTWLGQKSYEITKMATGGSGVRELSTGIVRKGVTGSAVSPLVGSNKVLVGSAEKLPENKSMAPVSGTTKTKKRKQSISSEGKTTTKKVKPDERAYYKVKKRKGSKSTGKYVGKLKKTKRYKKSVTLSKAAKNGYILNNDLTGNVSDPQCVYLYHSTYDINMIARGMIGGMLRALFKKAGIDVSNENTEFPLYDAAHSEQYKIVYNDRNPVTQDSTTVPTYRYEYTIVDNTTFRSMMDDICQYHLSPATPFKRLIDTMFGDSENIPFTLTLTVRDNSPDNVVSPWRTHTHLTLSNQRMSIICKSAIMVQNRTKGSAAGATDYSDQRIDNQPLRGKLYEFKNGDPRVRTPMTIGNGISDQFEFLFNSGASPSVRTWGQLVIPNDYVESPPMGKFWKNVKKTSNVLIQPGDIKSAEIEVAYDLPIPELIVKFRVAAEGAYKGPGIYYGLKSHKSQILALEEVLKTPADNFINAQFQVRQLVGAYCYAKPNKSVFRAQHFTSAVTQWVPP